MGIAAVQLDVVNVPGGEGLGISLQVPQYSWIASTGVVPIVLIDPKFQPLSMNLYRKIKTVIISNTLIKTTVRNKCFSCSILLCTTTTCFGPDR
jgi:hypothetical protein